MNKTRLVVLSSLLAVAACQANAPATASSSAQQTNTANANGAMATATNNTNGAMATATANANSTMPTATANSSNATSSTVSLACANTRFSIERNRSTGQTRLSYSNSDDAGAGTVIAPPGSMQGYAAVAVGCGLAKDGNVYFTVQYGAADGADCKFCEWFYLYDANGRALTESNPPVLEDPSLPPAQQQMPNNQQYQAKLAELGLQHPALEFLQ